jgi:branched-chain amino acid transport system permease protein
MSRRAAPEANGTAVKGGGHQVSRNATAVLLFLALAALVILPVFASPSLMNAFLKIMIAALFALAFALAMGQGGMLSFGHAAYYGLGAFASLHVMRAVEMHLFWFPTPLVPLAGAAAGLLSGIVFGWLATQRTGVYFAMLTFALSELLVSVAPGLNTVFGAESGISTMRSPAWGLSFGPDSHVYYLTLAWFVISVWCMWAFTKTPLGRLALALRDNEHRVRFLGFDTRLARTLIFALSCMFAGLAGGLLAIANESTNYTIFSTQVSAGVVLQTFIGGAGTFFGPALGAAVMTYFARVASDLTRSWLLYQGLVFVLVMLFAPGGLGGIVDVHARKVRPGGWRHLVGPYLLALVTGALLMAATVYTVESLYLVMSDAYGVARRAAAGGWPPYQLFGRSFEPMGLLTWAIPLGLFAAGGLLLALARRLTNAAWLRATQATPSAAADAVPPTATCRDVVA